MHRALIVAASGLLGATALGGATAWQLSRVGIHQGYAPRQPIAFSHQLHAGESKIPCLYCHSAARKSRHAGIPAANVCMNCHGVLAKETVEIQKLKVLVEQNRPIEWVKVHNLPDFVYFNHSRHVLAAVSCEECHGAVETMPRVRQTAPLTMGWCLDCHRQRALPPPAASLRTSAAPARHPPSAGLDCGKCHY
jgi:hypothetical protein